MERENPYKIGVAGFDQTFGLPMQVFVPPLLQAAKLREGLRILDVATGTGIAAEAALAGIGPHGHLTAVDASQPMLEAARSRLADAPNVTLLLEDAEAMTLPDAAFDAVLCCMSLHVFNYEQKAASEFYRVVRGGGTVAVSVNTSPENSLTGYIRILIAKYLPERREEIEAWRQHQFRLGDATRLRQTLETAGFKDVETFTETQQITYPSFDAYFNPIATGSGPWGVEFAALVPDTQQAIRDELRSRLQAVPGQPVAINVTIGFASGRK